MIGNTQLLGCKAFCIVSW